MAYGEYQVLHRPLSPMVHSSLGNVADDVEDNLKMPVSPGLLWRALGNRLYTTRAVGDGASAKLSPRRQVRMSSDPNTLLTEEEYLADARRAGWKTCTRKSSDSLPPPLADERVLVTVILPEFEG